MSAPKAFELLLPVDQYLPTEADQTRAAAEALLGMVPVHAAVLTAVAASVSVTAVTTEPIQTVIGQLYGAAQGQWALRGKAKKRTLVGLAAPQIGHSVRIVLIDTLVQANRKGRHKLECFINPEIIWRSRETAEGREGCFSAGEVWGLVRRPVAIKIRALTPAGVHVERIFEGFTARIAQHEIDHLDGIRFPERITSDKKRHWVHAEEIEQYVQHINHWPRFCTLDQWRAYSQPPVSSHDG